MIAEDTYVHLALLGYILSQTVSAGRLEPTMTSDGSEALQKIINSLMNHLKQPDQNHTTPLYDMVILDYCMPIIDGLKVARIMRAICAASDITAPPILLITAYDKDYFDAGDFDEKCIHMKKPASATDIQEIMKNFNLI